MPTFKTLWDNFPMDDTIKDTCSNKRPKGDGPDRPFDNYCAIKMSECFIRSGILLTGSKDTKCWSHKGLQHVLLAKDLATWLAKSPPKGFGKKEDIASGSFQKTLYDRTGLVYFKDYWQRGRESFADRSGDHIDLWKRNRITSASMTLRGLQEFLGFVSDLNDSKEIWFWGVK